LAPDRFAYFPEPDFSLGLGIFAVCVLPSTPILFGLALHRRRLDLISKAASSSAATARYCCAKAVPEQKACDQRGNKNEQI
jgi:hypothetical protein